MAINLSPYYSINPRICKAHSRTTFTVKPLYDFVNLEDDYKVSFVPRYSFHSEDRIAEFDPIIVTASDGILTFEAVVDQEQEYILYIVSA